MLRVDSQNLPVGLQRPLLFPQRPGDLGQAQVAEGPVGDLVGNEGEHMPGRLELSGLAELLTCPHQEQRIHVDAGGIRRHHLAVMVNGRLRSLPEDSLQERVGERDAALEFDRSPLVLREEARVELQGALPGSPRTLLHLARAGMPLHLLQGQLGHANIDQTMRYARFHPDNGDVGEYFETMAADLGLGHSLGHTPAEESEEEVQGARA